MGRSINIRDAAILNALSRIERALQRQAEEDTKAQAVHQQTLDTRQAKKAAMTADWREVPVNNNRGALSLKRSGDTDAAEPHTRKKVKAKGKKKSQESSDEEIDEWPHVLPAQGQRRNVVPSKGSQTKALWAKNVDAVKHHKKVIDQEVLDTSDSYSSDASEATRTSSSEDDERVSEDDLTLLEMSEKELAELFESERAVIVPRPTTAADISDVDVGFSAAPRKHFTKLTASSQSSLWTGGSRVSLSRNGTSFGSLYKSNDQLANNAEEEWPTIIRIFYNNGIKIRLQNYVIKTIIAEAKRCCGREMITRNAFPETGQRDEFRSRMAKQAIRSLYVEMKDSQAFKEAYYRSKKDTTFIHRIGGLAVGRLSHYRSEIRTAATIRIAGYQIGVGKMCKERVAALLKGNHFIYDGHWDTGADKNKWLFKSQTEYLNPVIIATIKTGWFNSSKSIGNQHREAYVSSLAEHPDEKEFTIPLVALAVTSVHVALSCWKRGIPPTKVKHFKGKLVGSIYQTFVSALEGLKVRDPVEFHRIMHSIYTSVCGNDGTGLEDDPFAVFDMDGV